MTWRPLKGWEDLYEASDEGQTFLGKRPKGMVTRHGPNGKLDNSVGNLSYGTRTEDQLDKYRDGTHTGVSVWRSDGSWFQSICQAAKDTGAARASISRCCLNKQKATCDGSKWQYAGDHL